MSRSSAVKCLLNGMMRMRSDSKSVISEIWGRWFVSMKSLNCGLNSKLFSRRYLAVRVLLPVICLVREASITMDFSGSLTFTILAPFSLATSSEGPEESAKPFLLSISGFAVLPYSPRIRSTVSMVVPLPLRLVGPYRINIHSRRVSPDIA